MISKKIFEGPRYREISFTLHMITRSKITNAAICIVMGAYILAIFAPYLSPYNPDYQFIHSVLQGPSLAHPLGTDEIGRDVLSRLLWGSRISMLIGIIVVVFSIGIGLPFGAIAGYFGGIVDEIMMRFTDIMLSFPGIVLAILFAYILGRGPIAAFIALSLVNWTGIARIVRGVVLVEKEKDYTIAARVLGKSNFSILFTEILPNSIQPVIIWGSLSLGTAIISLAGLSFIGVGVQPPTPDWGSMVASGYEFILQQPLLAIIPGVVIVIVALSFNIIGDSVQDAFDPQVRRAAQ